MLWLGFFICTALIVYSGARLSKYGDILAEKTGMGRTWLGVVLMASVTSLPELVTGISSVTFAQVPRIAIGDVLGSCVFNLLILALLDIGYRVIPLSAKAHQGNILSAGFGIILLGVVSMSLALGPDIYPVGWIGPYSLVFMVLYFLAMRMVFYYAKRQLATVMREKAAELKYEKVEMRTALINYGINATIVIAAATFLPGIGKAIAAKTGLGQTFVGNIFIAVSTSLPEVVVCVAALKIDAVDLAIGNLFGSNIFNIFILAVDDVFFSKGPILAAADSSQMISALSAMVMTGIAIIGLTYRAEKKKLFLAWDSVSILVVYIINVMLLYRYT